MSIERILIRVMGVIGIAFILLDITYYSVKFTPYLSLLLVVLFYVDVLLKEPAKESEKHKGLQKILIVLIGITALACALSLAYLWKLGPFGHFQ